MIKDFGEWADSIYNACIYKLEILKSSDNEFLNKIGTSIENFIIEEKSKIDDKYDLKSFRTSASNLLQLLGLLVQTSKPRANWLKPLLHECYSKLGIESTGREIFIAQFPEKIAPETSDGFAVYIDILKAFETFLPNDIISTKVDIFTLPSEAQFDLSCLPIFGHEIGHILWKEKFKTIILPITTEKLYQYLKEKGDKLDDLFSVSTEEEIYLAHTQEHFCDEIGRKLFKIVFDLSMIRVLGIFENSEKDEISHPPIDFRINESQTNILQFTSDPANQKFKHDIDEFINFFLFEKAVTKEYTRSKIVKDTVIEIFDALPPEIKNLEIGLIREFYQNIENELNAFRPPIEIVKKDSLKLNTPIQIVIGTILYNLNHNDLSKNNDFYANSVYPEDYKHILLKSILKEHLIYSINLYDFCLNAQTKFSFDSTEMIGSLWEMRERVTGGKSNPLTIVPSIYPKSQYGENSVDLRLGSHILLHRPSKYTHISPYPDDNFSFRNLYEEIYLSPSEDFILHPHQFVLASTLEYISLPFDFYGLILGRSSWGRLGLNIATATVVQAGFRGCITLELRNLGEIPIPIKVGVRIAQLCLVNSPNPSAGRGYYTQKNNKYIGPTKVQIPKIQEDIDWELINNA